MVSVGRISGRGQILRWRKSTNRAYAATMSVAVATIAVMRAIQSVVVRVLVLMTATVASSFFNGERRCARADLDTLTNQFKKAVE